MSIERHKPTSYKCISFVVAIPPVARIMCISLNSGFGVTESKKKADGRKTIRGKHEKLANQLRRKNRARRNDLINLGTVRLFLLPSTSLPDTLLLDTNETIETFPVGKKLMTLGNKQARDINKNVLRWMFAH